MRTVCIVVENMPVPLDRRVWSEACTLRDAGYLVSVVCPKGKNFTASYEVVEGIHIYRHRAWEASSPFGYILEYALALAAQFYLTFKIWRRTRFRVLQGCNPPDNIFLLALAFKPFGVRFVFDHHDLAPELLEAKFGSGHRLLGFLSRSAEKLSFKCATVSIATNESFKEIAIARGGKHPEEVFVVRNCPDLRVFNTAPAADTEKKSKRPFRVVYVGFMGHQDGLHLLLEAIDYIVNTQKRRDVEFVLIGRGTILPQLQAAVAEKGLAEFVTFTGQILHQDVLAYISNSDLGVAPDPKTAMNDNSTMIKIFEYMAFGLPVVLFDLKEGRRAACDAALYATPNDPVDFAHQVTALLDSSELRAQLGARGRKRIEDCLNWENEKSMLLRAYAAALQSG